jgi:beta-lactamase regulating signal transducer with metallopeptidase domain/HEAT repeat protein
MALVLLVKATALLLVALAASLLLQRASAGSRHLVWLVAVVGVLALPGVAAWGPLELRVLPAADVSRVEAWPLRFAQGDSRTDDSRAPVASPLPTPTPTPAPAPVAIESAPASSGVLPSLGLGTMLFGAWAVVALALALYLAYGAWSVHRIVARARPLDDPDWQAPLYEIADRLGLGAAPRLLRSEDVKMPFAAGLVSSTIVLPAESDGWSAERRSAVLIHELGHVRRRDLIGHTLGRVACALWWFHPLVWTAARRLRAESERACDDLALVFGARPSDYAEHLLDIVSCVRDHNTPAVALAMAHRREFEGRMLAILDPELRRRGMGRVQTAGLVGGLAALALVVGAAAPVPREAEAVAQAPSNAPARRQHVHVAVSDTAADIGVDVDSADVRVAVRPVTRSRSANASASASNSASSSSSTSTSTSVTAGGVMDSASARASARAAAIATATADTGKPDKRAEVLAKMLRSDTSAAVRRIAAWGLHEYGDNSAAVEALAAAVTGDANAGVREMAAWSLADADDNPAASAALATALRQDKDPKVRTTATWALGEVGDASATDALVPMLSDPNAETRELAAWAIGNSEPKKAPAALVSLLGDKNRDVRLSAAWALHNIEDGDATDAIEAAYTRETDPEVRVGLIRALGAMGDRAVDALQRLVSSPDPRVRKFAVTALAGGNASGPWPWPRPEPRPFPDAGEED